MFAIIPSINRRFLRLSRERRALQSRVADPKSLQTSLGESKKSPHYPLGHSAQKPGFSCLFFLYDLLLKRWTSVHFWGQIWTKPFLMKACAIPPWTSMNNISCLQQISLKPAQTNSNEPYPCALLGKNRLDRSDNSSLSKKTCHNFQLQIWIHPLDYKIFHIALNLVGYKLKHVL